MFDGEAFGKEMVEIVRGFVDRATAPLVAENKALAERIEALESRELVPPEKGDPGEVDMDAVREILVGVSAAHFATLPIPQDGKSVEIEVVKRLVDEAVQALPAPKDGADCDMAAVETMLDAKVADAVGALPPPDKGEPGRDVDMEVVATLIDKAVAAIPVPKDGRDCDMAEVERMLTDRVAAAVAALPAPKDGVGLASAFKDHAGHLVLTMTDGSTRDLGRIDGKDGETFTLDDFDIVPIDERSIKLCFHRGEVMHSFELSFPVVLDRGVWSDGKAYEQGDAVTWAGSLWIAQRATPGKPDTADGGWRLAVKRGRDGKDAGK